MVREGRTMSSGAESEQQDREQKAPAAPTTAAFRVVSLLRKLYRLSLDNSRYLLLVAGGMMIVAGYLALIHAPTVTSESFSAPQSQRIFYFHVPAAWIALLAFTVVFAASMVFLKTKRQGWDQLAYASAEVGVLFCTVAIVTGPFWAKAEWDVYWNDDPKLTVTLVLWLIYIGYLVFRNSAEEDDAELASILSIFGFITIPMTFLASRVMVSSHPNVVASDEGGLEGQMVVALVFSVLAFTVLYYYLLVKRLSLLRLKHRMEELKSSIGVMLHG